MGIIIIITALISKEVRREIFHMSEYQLCGFALTAVYCCCKGSWQHFCPFSLFPIGLYATDHKVAPWCWEIF